MHIKDDFEAGAPISQVPASWFNRVARFCNSLIGGPGVALNKHDDGCESVIELTGSGSDTTTPQTIVHVNDSTAQANTWSTTGGSASTDVGLKVTVCTDVYLAATLFLKFRTFTFNKFGQLTAVSGETVREY